jgi:GT2 family glycosyltransferase
MNAKHLSDIAVLIPSYNPGNGLISTLDSLRQQTVPYHLYIVDDGSPHKPDYATALKDIPHTLIELPRNAGITAALNAGLAEIFRAGHAYIARMDCGDEMTSGRLASQKSFMDQHPEVSILGSWIEMIYTENNRRFTIEWPTGHDNIVRDLWKNMSLSHPALMIRAESFRKLGHYSPLYDAAEDYELCRRAMQAGHHFRNIGEVLLIKTETRDSISWRKRRIQIKSRLRIQWRYRELANFSCIAGLVKTAAILMVPDKLAPAIKALVVRR